jgi:hypothetical protein
MSAGIVFQEWRDQNVSSKYPFGDNASLTNGTVTLPKSLFTDARIYAVGAEGRVYLSRIVTSISEVAIYFGDDNRADLAVGRFALTSVPDNLPLLDAYGRPAGILVSSAAQLATLASWGSSAINFTVDQTELTATVVVPTPEIGVRGFLVEGELFTGDIYLMGEQGVYLTLQDGDIRVDIIGDPRAKARFCEQLFDYKAPQLIRTINGYRPDQFGEFKLVACANLASDTALRVEEQDAGLGLRLIGDVLPNAPA